jgi:Integrase zinc binding domain
MGSCGAALGRATHLAFPRQDGELALLVDASPNHVGAALQQWPVQGGGGVTAWTARQGRHLSFVAEFTSDIRHIAGEDNIVADTPSWGGGPGGRRGAAGLRGYCRGTEELPRYPGGREHQPDAAEGEAELLCDTSGSQPRPLIPAAHRQTVFAAFHNMAHAGVKATGRVLGARVVWPAMKSDVQKWVADCQE